MDFWHFWRYNVNICGSMLHSSLLECTFNVKLKEEQENGKKNEDHGR